MNQNSWHKESNESSMEAIEEAYGNLCNVLTLTPMQKVWTLQDNVNDSAREQMGAQYGGPE